MFLETKRMILRPWRESDAQSLYEYASDPAVGPIAGWPAHKSLEESLETIRTVLSQKETFALCLKPDDKALGAIALRHDSDMTDRTDECELGYWLGKPFWGRGLMTEAVREMLRHAFEDAGMNRVLCGRYEGNDRSGRVQEKVGFRHLWTSPDVDVPLMHEKRKGIVSGLTRDQWKWTRMNEEAGSVHNDRKISNYVEAGGVAAAVMSSSGKIYTGVCVDTCCSLGICAERNAVFNMLTHGEQEIEKVLVVMGNGKNGAPCGACRELMVQLMPERYGEIQIMMDYEQDRVVTLGELTPEWWI